MAVEAQCLLKIITYHHTRCMCREHIWLDKSVWSTGMGKNALFVMLVAGAKWYWGQIFTNSDGSICLRNTQTGEFCADDNNRRTNLSLDHLHVCGVTITLYCNNTIELYTFITHHFNSSHQSLHRRYFAYPPNHSIPKGLCWWMSRHLNPGANCERQCWTASSAAWSTVPSHCS